MNDNRLDGDTMALPKKRRSGSEKRQRNSQVKLSLLDNERERLQQLADEGGFASVQQFILHRLEPDMHVAS